MGKYFEATDAIELIVHERIAQITRNRPDQRNALTPPMIASLHDALIEADARADVNVIVLKGAQATVDAVEKRASFLEKRAPKFSNR
ncbi:MAG: hypothetical protein ACLP2F_16170 [Steroidobacteraceae bacterium]